MTFKKDDWVFCEFELQQVTEVEDDRVVGVTTGAVSLHSHDCSDRCFALSIPVKRLSDAFEYESRKLHRKGSGGLNYPDIHRWLVDRWAKACRHSNDQRALESAYHDLDVFVRSILEKQALESGYGFPLFRTRAS